MNEKPRITIGYSTLADRVANIIFPTLQIPHKIIVSVQNPKKVVFNIPTTLSEISVIESHETGVTKSRNLVLANVTTEYLVFADDDATINPPALFEIIAYLDSHTECDLVTAITTNELGVPRKRYSKSIEKLTLFNSAKVGTIEMVLRVSSANRRAVRFDEKFGAGEINRLGDEYIFISDLLKRGGQGVFLPLPLASHRDESSGRNIGQAESSEDLAARAKVFTRVFGWKSPLIRAVFYLRRSKSGRSLSGLLRFVRG